MNHLTFEQISELAESREPGAESAQRAHLAGCAQCHATYERIERLLAGTRALPREVAPPPEVWGALHDRVTHRKRRAWNLGWLAAAAVVVFMVGAALLLPPSVGKGKGKGAVQPLPAAGVYSPVVLAVEKNYSATMDDLRRSLDGQRGTLSPATIRVVERSLATIDTAIAEARAALAADPSNQTLVQILSAHFESKVELLQRATELSSS